MQVTLNKDGTATVTITLDKTGKVSSTGKSTVHATGSTKVPWGDKILTVALNAYSK